MDGGAWYYEVGSPQPGAVAGPKGGGVHPLKRHVSWVQNGASQFSLYPAWALEAGGGLPLVREDRGGPTYGVPVVPAGASPGSRVGNG